MPKQIPIPIAKMNEPTFNVVLANGAVLTVRTVVMNVSQLFADDGTPMTQDGKTMYAMTIINPSVVVQDGIEKSEMN